MSDRDYTLLSLLKSRYPTIPTIVVFKAMSKYPNDEAKCIELLDEERKKYPEEENGSAFPNNTDSGLVTNRMRELQVSHGGRASPAERHVTTIEKSIVGLPRSDVSLKPWSAHNPERQLSQGTIPSGRVATSNSGVPTPQTAPADFTPFMFKDSRSPTDIPNIDCRTHAGVSSTQGSQGPQRPRQMVFSGQGQQPGSPGEPRRQVKVINIPPGSLSGGSVSPAATPSNPRHIRMHFGDTGGVCKVTPPPATLQRYGSSPNIGQHYRSEIRTETSVPQSLHSSSIVVNTTSHANHLSSERWAQDSGSGRRTPNPSLTLNTTPSDIHSSQPGVKVPSSGTPLSTPIQASSPGTSHSKPVFVEIKEGPAAQLSGYNSVGYQPSSNYYGTHPRSQPAISSYSPHPNTSYAGVGNTYNFMPSQQHYPSSQSTVPTGFPGQSHSGAYSSQPANHLGYNSPSPNLYVPQRTQGYNPSYPQQVVGYQSPGVTHFHPYNPNPTNTPVSHLPRSPGMVPTAHSILGNRSNSQDSDQGLFGYSSPETDPRLNNMGSRVSSHSSLSSESSSRGEMGTQPRSGTSIPSDEADYIQALLQHQKSRMQKLIEDMEKQSALLTGMRTEVGQLEKNMLEARSGIKKSFPSVGDISGLCESNRRLQTDIQMYMNEIDMYKSGQTPFNKIDPIGQQSFYENMPTGQQDPVCLRSPEGQRSPSPKLTPPPRPPPPIPQRQPSNEHAQMAVGNDIFHRVPPVPPVQPVVNSGDSEEGDHWSCAACTFSNHPALKKCEMCEMPRVMPSDSALSSLPPPNPLAATLPPRMAPGIVMQPRTGSAAAPLGHPHHHRAGT